MANNRFFKKNKVRDYQYNPNFKKLNTEIPIEERISFRKEKQIRLEKNQAFSEASNFREAYKSASERAHKRSNVELNKTFWLALTTIIIIIVVIIFWEF